MHPAKFNVSLFLSIKRQRKLLARHRQAREAHRNRARAERHRLARAHAFGKSSVIANLVAGAANGPTGATTDKMLLEIPAVFSMLDDPERVLGLVTSTAARTRYKLATEIFVDLSAVVTQDLGAHVLIDKLVDELAQESIALNRPIRWRGTYPKDPARVRLIRATGIIRQLKITHEYLPSAETAQLRVFQRHCRHYVLPTRPANVDDKSIAVKRFVDHVDSCLAGTNRRLTLPARSRLCDYVGEILDNAEQHAQMSDWTVQGYLDMSLAEPMCEIAILNFGKSFAQTLMDLPADGYTSRQVAEYLDLHARNGWFGAGWQREDLLTLIALQGMVSCKNTTEDSTRGQGTADLIEFFQQMHDECNAATGRQARMAILSGRTRVVFDGTYRIRPNQNGTRIIAFNQANDLKQQPDRRFVRSLTGGSLPGTLIAILFPISAASLSPTEERNANLPEA